MDDFRGKWKLGNSHSVKRTNKDPLIGMFYLGVKESSSDKVIGILKSFDKEKGTAVLEDAEEEEYVVKLHSLKFYQL